MGLSEKQINHPKNMKSFKCSDGFVTKEIAAATPQEAAEAFALVSCTVTVVEIGVGGEEIGEAEEIKISIE